MPGNNSDKSYDATAAILARNLYVANIAETKIEAYQGVLPEYERRTLALNLGELIEEAKEKGVQKGEVVIKANIRPNTTSAAAVNALNNYCLLAGAKSKRQSKPRLHAHPSNYLKLAITAAELMNMEKHVAIVRLTEGSNAFSSKDEMDEKLYSPAAMTWRLLRAKLQVLAKKYKLKDYFRETYRLSVIYDFDFMAEKTCWCQSAIESLSTSYWPSTYLATIIRSAVPAHFKIKDSEAEIESPLYAVEKVNLTLGWDTSERIFAFLEFLPGLAANPANEENPWFDTGYAGLTRSEGYLGDGIFRVDNGRAIHVPDGHVGNTWPYRLKSKERFELVTPQTLAETFTNCRLLKTSLQPLNPERDTTAVLSPADSPLALMEAELLERKFAPFAAKTAFLALLEKDVAFFTNSFWEWRSTQSKNAKQDHERILAQTMLELDALNMPEAPKSIHQGVRPKSNAPK